VTSALDVALRRRRRDGKHAEVDDEERARPRETVDPLRLLVGRRVDAPHEFDRCERRQRRLDCGEPVVDAAVPDGDPHVDVRPLVDAAKRLGPGEVHRADPLVHFDRCADRLDDRLARDRHVASSRG
jgi:hypothetical protein